MGRVGEVVVGIVCVVAGACWMVIWGALALVGLTFGPGAWGWVVVIASLWLGVVVVVFGFRFLAGSQHLHPPTRI